MSRPIPPDAIPDPVLTLCRRIEGAGFRAWIVGGCIRDLLMGKEARDWDVATSALPGEVQRVFRRTIPTGIEHGTVTVLLRGEAYEVTTLRGEGAYSDGRRPDRVEFVREIEADLARRDFTINAIAYDPLRRALIDPWGGLADLDARCIRAVGDPEERFGEDGLRVLRAARFASTLGFALAPATEAAIPGSLATFRKVSAERVQQEWWKALRAERPSPGYDVMRRTGILEVTCPPLAAQSGKAWRRTLARLDACPPDPVLRLAALLYTVQLDGAPEGGSLPRWADRWLRGLRTANPDRKRVVAVLAHRDLPGDPIDDASLRRWIRDVTRSATRDLLVVARAEAQAGGRSVDRLAERAAEVLGSGLPLTPAELPVGGAEVMATLDVPPSPRVGEVLAWLHERVLEDPAQNDHDRLVALLPEALRAVTPEPPA